MAYFGLFDTNPTQFNTTVHARKHARQRCYKSDNAIRPYPFRQLLPFFERNAIRRIRPQDGTAVCPTPSDAIHFVHFAAVPCAFAGFCGRYGSPPVAIGAMNPSSSRKYFISTAVAGEDFLAPYRRARKRPDTSSYPAAGGFQGTASGRLLAPCFSSSRTAPACPCSCAKASGVRPASSTAFTCAS